MTENYKQLIESLNLFKRKFYLNKLIQGVFLFFTILFIYILIVLVVEINLFLEPKVKIVILLTTLVFISVVINWYILLPLFRLFGISKTINRKELAEILRKNIPELEDTLVNIIELAEDNIDNYSKELITASIDQKINKIKIWNFNDAIKLESIKKYFLRVFIVVFVFGATFFAFKNDFLDGIDRLIYFQTKFIKPAPFDFILKNENLDVKKGLGVEIQVELVGRMKPEMIFISIGGNKILMNKKGDYFNYKIDNINNSFLFYVTADGFNSKQYRINVLPVPLISNFKVEVISPDYTNIEKFESINNGDIKIVKGAIVKWLFSTYETSELEISFNDSIKMNAQKEGRDFQLVKTISKNTDYSVSIKNEIFTENSILNYKIEIISDLYPQIEVVQLKDSSNFFRYYFKGRISDDYGFSNLKFRIFNEKMDSTISVQILKNLKDQEFYFTFDFDQYKGKEKVINYYFSVFDNDEIAKFKETSSNSFTLIFPSKQDLLNFEKENFKSIENLMEMGLKLNKEIKRDINDLKLKEIDSKYSEWEKQQKVKEIVEKREKLEDVLEEIKNKNKELNNYNNSFNEEKKEILEKQKQIEKLLKEVLSEELKKLFEEFNQLAKEFNASKMEKLSEDMDSQLDDLSKQLERNLEMLKKMKVTQTIQRIVDDLYVLSNKEKNLAVKLNDSKDISEALEQEKIDKNDFEGLKNEFEQILSLNRELKKPLKINDFDSEIEEIASKYILNIQLLDRGKKKNAEEGLKSISEKIENLAFSIKQQLESNLKKQATEDIDNIRKILDNLIYISIGQEELLQQVKRVQGIDPLIKMIKKDQTLISDQIVLVRDSLYALANRNERISGVINSELLNIQKQTKDALENLTEGNIYNVTLYQQNAINAINSLSLFISEILKKMEEDLASSMSGDQECSKPGKGKKSGMNMLKETQESIKKQLEKMIEQMKNGSTQGISEQLGKTIGQQETMQQIIREIMEDSEVGSSAKDQLKQVDQLIEQNKIELMSKNVSVETLNRQNMILNKLLKAEISERERDVEEERESKTAIDKIFSNPKLFFEYKKNKDGSREAIQRNNYQLEPYYDKKFKKYNESVSK